MPVLSNTKVSTQASVSKAASLRTNTPPLAKVPALASMAAGVANDNAHGQVTTSTATATISAWAGSCGHHHAAAPNAANKTKAKNGLAIRSASTAAWGLVVEALCIKATIWAKRVASAMRTTRINTVVLRL